MGTRHHKRTKERKGTQMNRKEQGKLMLPKKEVDRLRQEALGKVKARMQEITDTDYTETEIFDPPLPTDNAGITCFRLARFLQQMTPIWAGRAGLLTQMGRELDGFKRKLDKLEKEK